MILNWLRVKPKNLLVIPAISVAMASEAAQTVIVAHQKAGVD